MNLGRCYLYKCPFHTLVKYYCQMSALKWAIYGPFHFPQSLTSRGTSLVCGSLMFSHTLQRFYDIIKIIIKHHLIMSLTHINYLIRAIYIKHAIRSNYANRQIQDN